MVEVEAHFSHRLADILAGRLNMGTPSWVLDKTKGLKLASGESVLFVSGLLSVSNQREVQNRSFCQTPETNFTWVPEPPRIPRPGSGRRTVYDREDFFGYKPVRRPASAAADVRTASPKPGRPSQEYKKFTKNNGERWDNCLSQRLFTDTVKRPQLYPFHARLNGESMHSFLVGSRYNKKNYNSPAHIQLFDYYPPSDQPPEEIERKYRGLRCSSAKLRTVSSETELTSKLKHPLPKDVLHPTFQPSRPTSARSDVTSPKRPATQQQQSRRPRVDQFRLRRLHSAPSHRQISHLQGFTKQVFDRLEMGRPSSRNDKGVSVGSSSRPLSAMSHKSGGSSDCVICNSPDLWKAYVEQQRYHSHAPHEDADEMNNEELNDDKVQEVIPEEPSEAKPAPNDSEPSMMNEKGNQAGDEEENEEMTSSLRIFATEPVLDSEDKQPPVMGVEIIVRERPKSAESDRSVEGANSMEPKPESDVIVINQNTDFPPGPEEAEAEEEDAGTRHVSSPVPKDQ